MRMALTFDTERYVWLIQSLFVAHGRLLGANAIEYDVYRCSDPTVASCPFNMRAYSTRDNHAPGGVM